MTAKAVTGIFLVFFLGAVAGGLLSSIFFAHRAAAFLQRGGVAYVELLERRTTHGLGLDPGQKEQVHRLLMMNLAERQRLQLQIQPQIQALNKETMRQIRTVLRPDQEEGFRKNLREFHRLYGRPGLNVRMFDQAGQSVPAGATNSTSGSPAPAGLTNAAPQ
jgi:hypothetical protein